MFAKLKNLIAGAGENNGAERHHLSVDEKHLAAAVLLVEAAMQDEDFTADEEAMIVDILQRYLSLTAEESTDLLSMARQEQEEAIQLHRFTRSVKDLYAFEERVEMIEMLWEVAYADGVLHDYEESLVRKIAGLIYVSDKDRGEARKRVLDRMNIQDA